MNGFLAVYRRELASYFQSAIFYVVAFVFLGIFGYLFFASVLAYGYFSFQAQDPMMASQLNGTEMVLTPLFHDTSVVMLLVMPLLTMRAFAEERKTGTLELLFTYPLRDLETLLGKLAAVLTVFGIVLAGTLPCVAFLSSLTPIDPGVIASSYTGLFLLGSAFLCLGIFVSSLTENQIVAAVVSFGALLAFWLIGVVEQFSGGGGGGPLSYLSILEHFDAFTRGVVDTRDVAFYLLFCAFFLFGTLRVLESMRWRG
ncbi:MAG: ABC transporter permease [Deltaproteobacteria bacterium]|nr:ABC transporter permease [Deltaproteobacteria bacterium]